MRDFNYTVDVLVKAYLNDTLESANCFACAVGNMVADACGYKFEKRFGTVLWIGEAYPAGRWGWFGLISDNIKSPAAIHQVNSTGYSVDELRRIENAFEDGCSSFYDSDNADLKFNGLMAVVDVLAEIHGIDLKQKEEAKALFVKA